MNRFDARIPAWYILLSMKGVLTFEFQGKFIQGTVSAHPLLLTVVQHYTEVHISSLDFNCSATVYLSEHIWNGDPVAKLRNL